VAANGSSQRSPTCSGEFGREISRNPGCPRVALDLRASDTTRDVQVPPELLAVRNRRTS
jgi:hypothetical protein